MTSANILDAYPLAPLQLGMMQNELRMPGAGIDDLEQLVFTLREPVDPQRLRRVWIEAMMRHPILRIYGKFYKSTQLFSSDVICHGDG